LKQWQPQGKTLGFMKLLEANGAWRGSVAVVVGG
jgi:hypothetical protein